MQTYMGRKFWPLDPRLEDIYIEDIAHSLSNQCRFAGHCKEFYSVAEHSVRVASLLEGQSWDLDVCLLGLLHDASEAYLVDLPRPVKRQVEGYSELERVCMQAIIEKYDLHEAVRFLDRVKEADEILLATEQRDLMSTPPDDWRLSQAPLPSKIVPWSPKQARAAFHLRFQRLTQGDDCFFYADDRRRAIEGLPPWGCE